MHAPRTQPENPDPIPRSFRRRKPRSARIPAPVSISVSVVSVVLLQLLAMLSLLSSSIGGIGIAVAAEEASVGDDYAIAEGNRSLMVALGCFWCAEQAFEQYAPGVVEAVSGYAGGINDNPTYRNHPGHYEVILIEYDPSKTSYEVLVNYAYRNMDPFDGTGQFCDKGSSYYPAIFYATEEERLVAEEILDTILLSKNWDEADIAAPILPRPVFWTAEDYHQDYYIKNPSNYGYYKNACRRPQRLKQVWGEDEYKCYHEEAHTCFVTADDNDLGDVLGGGDNNATAIFSGEEEEDGVDPPRLQITNSDGELVAAESNIKNADAEKAGILPSWAIIVIVVVLAIVVLMFATGLGWKLSQKRKEDQRKSETATDAEPAKNAEVSP